MELDRPDNAANPDHLDPPDHKATEVKLDPLVPLAQTVSVHVEHKERPVPRVQSDPQDHQAHVEVLVNPDQLEQMADLVNGVQQEKLDQLVPLDLLGSPDLMDVLENVVKLDQLDRLVNLDRRDRKGPVERQVMNSYVLYAYDLYIKSIILL